LLTANKIEVVESFVTVRRFCTWKAKSSFFG